MARSKRRDRSILDNTPRRTFSPTWSAFNDKKGLTNVEDNRVRQQYPKTIYGTEARVISTPIRKTKATTVGGRTIASYRYETIFARPMDTTTCVRRKIREEVIHATGKAGRKKQRKPKFNWKSKIRCK